MEPLKEKVLTFLQRNGPALQLEISRGVERESIFVGAVLSELLGNKVIKISKAKVGGSPLYYMKGQEEKLSRLYNSLQEKEKEAYNLLKEKRFILDKTADPSIRVALQMLNDFAFSMEVKNEKVWRWHLAKEEEFVPRKRATTTTSVKKKEKPKEIETKQTKLPNKKVVKQIDDEFSKLAEAYLQNNKIKIIQRESQKKNREISMIIEVPSSLGAIEMYLLAKNKKTINDNDLILAYNRGNEKKLPTLFLITGKVTKKAELYKEKNLKGYVIVKSL